MIDAKEIPNETCDAESAVIIPYPTDKWGIILFLILPRNFEDLVNFANLASKGLRQDVRLT